MPGQIPGGNLETVTRQCCNRDLKGPRGVDKDGFPAGHGDSHL